MKSKPHQPETPDTNPVEPASGPDLEALSAYIKEKETDENIEKLAEEMSKAWSEDAKNQDVPGLTFSDFLEKLKKEKGQ
jgi:hypothetical protein